MSMDMDSSLLAALSYLVDNPGPVVISYPYVTDARRVAAQMSGARSWAEVLKRFATYSVSVASYQAPFVRDLNSLKGAVAAVGAAFFQRSLYGPVEVLDLLWDEYKSCDQSVSRFASEAYRYSPYADVLRVASSFQDRQAVLIGEDGALFPVSVLRPLYEYYMRIEKEPKREVREFAVSVPILDPGASVAEAARLVRRFGLAALPGDRIVTAIELLKVPLALKLDHFYL